MDCTTYENCLQNQEIFLNLSDQNSLHMVAVGCWGVYCDDGEYIIAKYKKGQIQLSKVLRGQKRVANALAQYTTENKVTDMYLAGDNIYQLGISSADEKEVGKFLKTKQDLIQKLTGIEVDPLQNFNIEKQLSEGFEQCFNKAKIDRYFVAVGNHDIENCNVLNQQYNYKKWIMPSLYYNVLYKLRDFSINIIVLDTNMFDSNPVHCTQKPFSFQQIETQYEWAISHKNKGHWNIVIGHIPYLANGHKKDKPVFNQVLAKLINIIEPDLYICADEHNQQFIQTERTAIVVAGSGGTELDDILEEKIQGTKYINKTFGFVSYVISKNEIKVTFISPENKELFSHSIRHYK